MFYPSETLYDFKRIFALFYIYVGQHLKYKCFLENNVFNPIIRICSVLQKTRKNKAISNGIPSKEKFRKRFSSLKILMFPNVILI